MDSNIAVLKATGLPNTMLDTCDRIMATQIAYNDCQRLGRGLALASNSR